MKKIIQRTCIGCKVKKDKSDLIRIVRQTNGELAIDKTGKLPGRGAYICGDEECLEKIIKSNMLNKILECNVPEEIYEKLRGAIDE